MGALRVLEGHAYVSDLYVARRRRGVGRALLRHLLGEAAAAGLRAAVADVFEGNDAPLELFTAEGFAVEREYVDPALGVRVLRLSLTF